MIESNMHNKAARINGKLYMIDIRIGKIENVLSERLYQLGAFKGCNDSYSIVQIRALLYKIPKKSNALILKEISEFVLSMTYYV